MRASIVLGVALVSLLVIPLAMSSAAASASCQAGTVPVTLVNLTPGVVSGWTIVMPASMVEGSCPMVGVVEAPYAVWGGLAFVQVPVNATSMAILANTTCETLRLQDALLAWLGYGGDSGFTTVEWAPRGYTQVGGVTVDTSIGDLALLAFTPSMYNSSVASMLAFTTSVDSGGPLTIVALYAPGTGTGIQLGLSLHGCVDPGVAVEYNGSYYRILYYNDTAGYAALASYERLSLAKITIIVYNNTLTIYVNDTRVYSGGFNCPLIDGVIVYQAVGNRIPPQVTSYLLLYAYHGLPVSLSVSAPSASITAAIPSQMVLGNTYTVNITVYTSVSGTVGIFAPTIGMLNSTTVTPSNGEASVSLEVKPSSALAAVGCLYAGFIVNGTLWAAYRSPVYIVPSVAVSQSWMVKKIIPYGDHGYAVYGDGSIQKLPGLPYTLALIGPGYAGCTIDFYINDEQVYETTLGSTAIDVLIPFNFSTPAEVVVTKQVLSTGCTVTVKVRTMNYYKVIINPISEQKATRPNIIPNYPPGILDQVRWLGLRIDKLSASILVSAFASMMALYALRRGNTLSTAIITAGLFLFAMGILIGGEYGYRYLVVIGALIIGVGVGIKMKLG